MKGYCYSCRLWILASVLVSGCGGVENGDLELDDSEFIGEIDDTSDGKADGIVGPIGTFRDTRASDATAGEIPYFPFNLLVLKSDKTYFLDYKCPKTGACSVTEGIASGTYKFTKTKKNRYIEFLNSDKSLFGKFEYRWKADPTTNEKDLQVADTTLKATLRWKSAGWFKIDTETAYCHNVNDCYEQELIWDDVQYACKKKTCIAEQMKTIPGFTCFRMVHEVLNTAYHLAEQYPTLAQVIDIGDSWKKTNGQGGDDLLVLRITNTAITEKKPVLFSMGAIHGNELPGPEILTRFAEHLLGNYTVNPTQPKDPDITWLVDHHEIHLLFMTNPDGRRLAENWVVYQEAIGQKTDSFFWLFGARASGDPKCQVDLNRNFSFEWDHDYDYCGSAGSAPETQAISSYVTAIFEDFRDESKGSKEKAASDATGLFIDYHAPYSSVYFPWGFSDEEAPDGKKLSALAKSLAGLAGYQARQLSSWGGGLTGTTADFVYGELGVPAFLIETNDDEENCATFETKTFPQNLKALLYAAKLSRKPYKTASAPRIFVSQVQTQGTGTSKQVKALITDYYLVASAKVYIQTPPWKSGAKGIAMSAEDGAFDSKAESVTAEIDTSSFAPGNYDLFVVGVDDKGNEGLPTVGLMSVLP